MTWRRKTKHKSINNNRIYLLAAIVFLLFLGCVYKLYKIQVVRGDYFKDLAGNQHRMHSELKPERGEILIEKKSGGDKEYYALATNRDFALVYAIPKDISEEKKLAEKLYKFFDQEKIENEVKKDFREKDKQRLNAEMKRVLSEAPEGEKQSKIREVKQNFSRKKKNKEWKEERQKKIEEQIEIRKGKIIKKYEQKLSKENDPYESLKKKVKPEKLKEMYVYLDDVNSLEVDDLLIKNGKIYRRKGDMEIPYKYTGISHVMDEYRYYPEERTGSNLLGFVGYGSGKGVGSYGLEGFFNSELAGDEGFIKTQEEKTEKETLTINNKKYKKAMDGSDLVLSIEGAVQFYVCEKLNEVARKHGADGGSVVVVNPETGAIMSMCSYPNYNPNKYSEVEDIDVYNNPAVFDTYEPGSVFKTMTMAAALNEEAVSPYTTYEDKGKIMIEGWDKAIKNSDFSTHGPHGVVDMNYVLEYSLNTGSIFAMKKTGPQVFADYVKKFGFGEQTGIELEGEGTGHISNIEKGYVAPIYAATASYGQGITATPLQVTMAYAALANDGILMKPYIVKEVRHSDGSVDKTNPVQVRRVVSEEVSNLISGMLVNVVQGGHAKEAGVKGYYVGGKTGTAQVASEKGGYGSKTIHTFVGYAPIEDSKFVMLVKLDDPKDVQYSASSAAPLFGDLAEFMLNYYQVPKTR